MGGGLHGNDRAGEGRTGDGAFGEAAHCPAHDIFHRSQAMDEKTQVVGPHIEHRSASVGVIKGWVGMPALVSAAGANESGEERLANRAFGKELADVLSAGS